MKFYTHVVCPTLYPVSKFQTPSPTKRGFFLHFYIFEKNGSKNQNGGQTIRPVSTPFNKVMFFFDEEHCLKKLERSDQYYGS